MSGPLIFKHKECEIIDDISGFWFCLMSISKCWSWNGWSCGGPVEVSGVHIRSFCDLYAGLFLVKRWLDVRFCKMKLLSNDLIFM